jgi:dienelactone hydrolase
MGDTGVDAEDPTAIGRVVLDRLTAGDFGPLRDMFAPSLRPMVSPDTLRAVWSTEMQRRGALTDVGTPVAERVQPDGALVTIPVTFERGAATVLVSVTDAGWVAGIQFGPPGTAEPAQPWQPPQYADPGTFEEQDLVLGSGPLAVPAALSLPRRVGRLPAVVLLAGSGPHDRDETIGRNKPFKDLAWGLAAHGVIALRFDKVTYAHPREALAIPNFTLTDEYAGQVDAALELLRRHPHVDPGAIFLLGHSLGGTVAPRLAATDASVAGLILLAGGAEPMHHAALRQVRYLSRLDPAAEAAYRQALDTLTRQAAAVDAPELSPSTPKEELPFGVSASYWLDVRDYDPAATAATLDRPILIVQGGRDYQVTVEDDLALWRAALTDRANVTIRIHDADNHLFFAGTGPSTPAEYEAAQHIDADVVTEIADWIGTTAATARGA